VPIPSDHPTFGDNKRHFHSFPGKDTSFKDFTGEKVADAHDTPTNRNWRNYGYG